MKNEKLLYVAFFFVHLILLLLLILQCCIVAKNDQKLEYLEEEYHYNFKKHEDEYKKPMSERKRQYLELIYKY